MFPKPFFVECQTKIAYQEINGINLKGLGSMFTGLVSKAQTIAGLISDWNESVESSIKEVEAYNRGILKQYEEGSIHPKALAFPALERMPQKLKQPCRSWCQWWRTAWGWSMLTRSADSQQWLPYDHCDLSATRDHVADLLATGTHPGLVLNYDQIWRNSYDVSKFKLRVVEIDVEYIFHLLICQGDEAPKLLLQVLKCKLSKTHMFCLRTI